MNKVLSNTANQIITRKEDEIARLKAENKRLQYTASLNLTYAQSCITRTKYAMAQIVIGNIQPMLRQLDGLTSKGYKELCYILENYLDIPVSKVWTESQQPGVYACGSVDRKLLMKCNTNEEAFDYVEEHDNKIQLKDEDQLRALMVE
jgi:hypothetical protein